MEQPYQGRSPETERGFRGRAGRHVIVAIAALVAAVWAFAALLEAVLDNATLVTLDVGLEAMARDRASPRGLAFFDVVSRIGSPTIVAWAGVIGAAALWRRRDWRILAAWALAFAGSRPLELALKAAVHRNRPSGAPKYRDFAAFSFPSGHSIAIVVGVSMLLYVVFRYRQPAPWVKASLIAAGVVAILLVGVSRVYIGAHYPSDVLGGYAVATGWVAACLGMTATERRSGRVSSQ